MLWEYVRVRTIALFAETTLRWKRVVYNRCVEKQSDEERVAEGRVCCVSPSYSSGAGSAPPRGRLSFGRTGGIAITAGDAAEMQKNINFYFYEFISTVCTVQSL